MITDKEFLDRAITEVYKSSLVKNDKKMQTKVRELLHSEDIFKEEIQEKEKELKYLEECYKQEEYTCYIDGSVSIDNDDISSGASYVIYLDEDIFYKYKYKIPTEYSANGSKQRTSSHIAEYQALIMLLRTLVGKIIHPEKARIKVNTDSKVLVGQYNSEYRVTNDIQKELRNQVFDLVKKFKCVDLNWIPREENQLANDLAKEVTDCLD